MQRLVTFGCSNTYGHGLQDCFDPKTNRPGNTPSKFAWPQVLSDLLNVPCVNSSVCGTSNLEITTDILNFKFNKDDCVIVLWTHLERDLIFKEPSLFKSSENIKIGSWIDEAVFKNWCKVHSYYDMAIRGWYNVHHASLYLESLGIEHYNFFTDHKVMLKSKPDAIDVSLVDVNFFMLKETDMALDNKHPGPLAHNKIATEIKTEICK